MTDEEEQKYKDALKEIERLRGYAYRLIENEEYSLQCQTCGAKYTNLAIMQEQIVCTECGGIAISIVYALKAEIKRLKTIILNVQKLCDHNVPYYAYGDNEAAADFADRLNKIYAICAIKGEK